MLTVAALIYIEAAMADTKRHHELHEYQTTTVGAGGG